MPDEAPFDPSGLFPGLAKGQSNTIAVAGFNDALKAVLAGVDNLLSKPRPVAVSIDLSPSVKEFLMGFKDDLLAAVDEIGAKADAERAEVSQALADLNAKIAELTDKVNSNPDAVNADDVARVKAAADKVSNIYTPPAPPEPPAPPAE